MTDEPSRHTFAWFHKQTDAKLRRMLGDGPIGNRDVDSARAELESRWTRRALWAAVTAAIAAAVGAVAAIAGLLK